MAKLLDQVLVIDIESTCWEGEPPAGQESEIIEIGICPIDVRTGARFEKRSLLVRPKRSEISAYCTQLTTLTPDQVQVGIPLQKACSILKREYHSKDRVWASYGDYDRRQFERQCRSYNVAYPFGPTHLNVKSLFALTHALPHEVGMAEALEQAGLPLEGTHHRAGDDAHNIATILSDLLLKLRSTNHLP